MDKYLTVMVTALVLTQLIRLVQNTISLRRLKGNATEAEVVAMWEQLVKGIERLADKLENDHDRP